MKKIVGIILLVLCAFLVMAGCDGDVSKDAEPKDISMLLSGLGKDFSMIESLGELPDPEVAENFLKFNNKKTNGYFGGFDFIVEKDADEVTRIEVAPIKGNRIYIHGFMIGDSIAVTDELFGEGIISTAESNGESINYVSYTDVVYDIRCTVEDDLIIAASFTLKGANEPSTIISPFLLISEIKEYLGDDYTFETYEDGGYFTYYSELVYDDILFTFFHDRNPLAPVNVPDDISITSTKYALANLDVRVGDLVKDVFEECDNKFENAWDHHNDKYVYGIYTYVEDGKSTAGGRTNWLLSFGFDEDVVFEKNEDIPRDLRIEEIYLWTLQD